MYIYITIDDEIQLCKIITQKYLSIYIYLSKRNTIIHFAFYLEIRINTSLFNYIIGKYIYIYIYI